MLFGRKQKKAKMDPRVRYQQSSFTRKLDQARNYKREAAPVPDSRLEYFLNKVGLSSLLSRIVTALALVALVYLIFVPNFLSPRYIEVQGAGNEEANQVRSSVAFYLDHAPFYQAQHNIIFLSKNNLQLSLLTDPKIYKVNSIKKNLWRRQITVNVELKTAKYLVNRGNNLYSVYNDGTVEQQLRIDPLTWLDVNPGIIKIKDEDTDQLSQGENYLSPDLITVMEYLQQSLRSGSDSAIDYFAIPNLVTALPALEQQPVATATATISMDSVPLPSEPQPQQHYSLPLKPDSLFVFIKKQNHPGPESDIKLVFDTKQDLGKAITQLQLLFSNMDPVRYANLVYIDIRFDNRAFLCVRGAACAQDNYQKN